MTTATTPTRDVSPNASAIGSQRTCLMCTRPPASARARYCSPACRQRSFRLLRRSVANAIDDRRLRTELRQRGALVAHTVYECSNCGERRVGERRCPDCNLYCRALGVGGHCAECEQPILLAELLDLEVAG